MWDILDLALWREARNQTDEAIAAVACSIFNRTKKPMWWNWYTVDNYAAVILYPFAYSSFLSSDPNFKLAPKANDLVIPRIVAITAKIRAGEYPDTVDGAQSYYSGLQVPGWAAAQTHVIDVGAFKFFRV